MAATVTRAVVVAHAVAVGVDVAGARSLTSGAVAGAVVVAHAVVVEINVLAAHGGDSRADRRAGVAVSRCAHRMMSERPGSAGRTPSLLHAVGECDGGHGEQHESHSCHDCDHVLLHFGRSSCCRSLRPSYAKRTRGANPCKYFQKLFQKQSRRPESRLPIITRFEETGYTSFTNFRLPTCSVAPASSAGSTL